MTKLVYSLDSADSALEAIRRLRALDVPDKCISLIARSDIELEQIPDRFVTDSTDFGPAVARGAALGGTMGAVAGLIVGSFPLFGIALGGGALLLATAGAAVGAWSSAMMGAATPNEVRRHFEDEIERGRVLLAVDAREEMRATVEEALESMGERARMMPPIDHLSVKERVAHHAPPKH
ncbi:MAG TPA: hypothetical protein VFL14_04555 [Xanthomonadales bacterium]|nr:hypothetical protein [Xanthomonadales bacterium]